MYDRTKTIGASDAVMIGAGDWAELFDRKTAKERSASNYPLAAELGHKLEAFNLELYTRSSGHTVYVDSKWQEKPLTLPGFDWCTYLPDGMVERDTNGLIPIEAKAVNMMWNPINLLNKYMPQLQHAMRVTATPSCIFSVIYLNTRYEYTEIPYDPPYDNELFEKEQLFHYLLINGIRPPEYGGKRKGWIE